MMGTFNCCYETPCGWCIKWDKRCDRKIGCNDKSKYGNIFDSPMDQQVLEDLKKGIDLQSLGIMS